ncbi:MAG: tRNA (adenosine(37)-N6)-threonylcarbamoyltransferase complex dimerization subunit type 1 TsaB [Mycobacteriales bacterium]
MRVLVLDTSTPAVSAGLVDTATGEVLAERVVVDGRRHGELLAVGLREVLAAGNPDEVVVGVGPGPFTGLRVGIVTAAAFASARGLPVRGVCSLDGLAAPGTVVVTDARRKEVYWAVYDGTGARVDGPHVSVPSQVPTAGLRVVGDGARLYGLSTNGLATEDEPLYPSVARLAQVTEVLPLTPLYLRRPDAVEPGASKKVTA